jgi:capsular polysaccharide export protein
VLLGRITGVPKTLYIYQFPYWKWPVVKQCFPASLVVFIDEVDKIPSKSCLVLWGMCPLPDGLSSDVHVLRLEDGFLRSVGLGADLIRPLSWVVDQRGIHYNVSQPSDLEYLCETTSFDEALLHRAACLRSKIVEAGLTKYNVGANSWQRPISADYVILVPGQVESDASLLYGAVGERTNMGLLRTVREAYPNAYLIYKPHPDIIAGLRAKAKDEQAAYRWCNEVVTDVSINALFDGVDEVHVLTSLAGFEALLRGKLVTCYGQPFYSGWGLTKDILLNNRRTRCLTLDELVAAALIKYPIYFSRNGKGLITPEQALDEMLSWRARCNGSVPWWRSIVRFFLRLIVGVK